MALTFRTSGPLMVMVSGMDPDVATREQWRAGLFAFARNIQGKIANTFAAQRTARGALRRNDPKYTAAKVRQGYDPRKGHRTNTLQSVLRPGASQLFVVIGPDRFGNGRIIMQEGRLHDAVPYAEYYEEKKVVGGFILAVAQSWLRPLAGPLFAVDASGRLAMKTATRGRPLPIRAALGLTRSFAGSLALEAQRLARARGGRALSTLMRLGR